MRERAGQAAVDAWKDDSPNGKTVAGLRDKFLSFAASEVQRDREESAKGADPALVAAEDWLDLERVRSGRLSEAAIIIVELDRRAALLAQANATVARLQDELDLAREQARPVQARLAGLMEEVVRLEKKYGLPGGANHSDSATRTVWITQDNASEAIESVLDGDADASEEQARQGYHDHEANVYRITITAQRVERKTP